MKIRQIVTAIGHHGFAHKDLPAMKAGAKPNGFLFEGPTVLPGFRKIVQAGSVLSLMLVLEDGSVAQGDCLDVIFAGAAGRDPLFDPEEHTALVRGPVTEALVGQDVSAFRPLAERLDGLKPSDTRLHTALRYGISQALLHATALARRELMAEVVAREYGSSIGTETIPILVSIQKTDMLQLDRMIMKRAGLLPHASFTVVEADLGDDGHKLLDYAGRLAARIREIGASDYHPRIHLDTYGTLGELFANDTAAIVRFIARVAETVAPYPLLIESPIIAKTMEEQIALYRAMRQGLATTGCGAKLVVDEWCNTLDDIRLFGAAEAADFVQIKAPDLGGLTNAIEAVLYCRKIGLGCCLGGTANETDHSSRITTHVGMACGPDFLLGKPGLGGDEALMIQTNEMRRTIALLAARAGR